eukprot:11337832-Alexandrium_andersonii.AAC.1
MQRPAGQFRSLLHSRILLGRRPQDSPDLSDPEHAQTPCNSHLPHLATLRNSRTSTHTHIRKHMRAKERMSKHVSVHEFADD